MLGSITHSFELMLSSFILGLALGGWWIRRRIDRIADPGALPCVVQVLMGLFAVLTLPVYASTFDLMAWSYDAAAEPDDGWILYNLFSQFLCLLVMLPATFLAGMTLPLITFQLMRSRLGEKSIGNVYAANTLGAIVGVIVARAFRAALPRPEGRARRWVAQSTSRWASLLLYRRGADRARRLRNAWSAAGVAGRAVRACLPARSR